MVVTLLTVLPILLVAALVFWFGVDAPLIDHWSMVEDLKRYYAGTWGLSDLFRSHNGHRLFVPRLILVPLADLTGWNTRVEMGLNLVAALGILWVLGRRIRRCLGATGATSPMWVLPVVSLALFSLNQWENWLWGFQINVFLVVLWVVWGFEFFGGWALMAGRYLGAVLFGLLATLTQGSGLVYWPVGAAMILAIREVSPRRSGALLLLWLAIAAAVYVVYFQRLPEDSTFEVSRFAVESPWRYLRFVLSLLGAPVVSFSGSAWPPRESSVAPAVGAIGLVLYAVSARRAIHRLGPERAHLLLPLLGWAAFSLGVTFQIGISRGVVGPAGAMASRYMTLTTPFWISLLGHLAVASRPPAEPVPGRAGREWPVALMRLAVASLAVLMLASSVHSVPVFPAHHALEAPARAEMLRGEVDGFLQRLHPRVESVRKYLDVLRAHRLSVFREPPGAVTPPARPVPLRSFAQSITLKSALSSMPAGGVTSLRVRVSNPSEESWPAEGDGFGHYAVRLSYHWFDSADRAVVFNGRRTLLPRDIHPGESVQLTAEIEAPETPGQYVLRLTMVQEIVKWFDADGGGPPASWWRSRLADGAFRRQPRPDRLAEAPASRR